jgi:hypothetical protein
MLKRRRALEGGAAVKDPAGDLEQGTSPGKRPLDPHLLSGARGTVDDVRVQSGYPLWNLVDAWIATGQDDEAVVREYHLDPAEWAAAKRYYLDHKLIIDARIIANTQPDADDDVPPLRSVEEYFAWLLR